MNTLHGIHPEAITSLWPDISAMVTDACLYNGGRYDADDCLCELLVGKKQLWIVNNGAMIRAVVITGFACFPRKKCLTIDICTGEGLDDWKHLLAIIEEWAKGQECTQSFLFARPGMRKKLLDYRKTHELLEKDL